MKLPVIDFSGFDLDEQESLSHHLVYNELV